MKNEIEFAYNLYIGKHMREPLKYRLTSEIEDPRICEVTAGGLKRLMESKPTDMYIPHPIVKPLDTLTDEEWMFVFGKHKNVSILKTTNFIQLVHCDHSIHVYNIFDKRLGVFNICDQEMLNRLYSLHRSPDEKILEEKGLVIIDREGEYYE